MTKRCHGYAKSTGTRCMNQSTEGNFCNQHQNCNVYKSSVQEQKCPICLENCDIISTGEKFDYLKTNCGHSFHYTCIVKWKQSGKDTCPLCREPLANHWLVFTRPTSGFESDFTPNPHLQRCKKRRVKLEFENTQTEVLNVDSQIRAWKGGPIGWFNYLKIDSSLIPFYSLTDKNQKPVHLDLYGHHCISHFPEIENWVLKKIPSMLGSDYNHSHELWTVDYSKTVYKALPYFKETFISREVLMISAQWIFEVMHQIKRKHKIVYRACLNTAIYDLLFSTIRKTKPKTSEIQDMLIAAMYVAVSRLEVVHVHLSEFEFYYPRTYEEKGKALCRKYVSMMKTSDTNFECYL